MSKVKAFFLKVLKINPAFLFGICSVVFYLSATSSIALLEKGPLHDMTNAIVAGLWCAAYIVATAICLRK